MEIISLDSANRQLESDFIHVLWAYHRARVDNGTIPFTLKNPLTYSGHAPNSLLFESSLSQNEIEPLNLIRHLRDSQHVTSVISRLSDGITSSIWNSCNQIVDPALTDYRTPPHEDAFIYDSSLRRKIRESIEIAKMSPNHGGVFKLHAGIDIGIRMISYLSALEYGIGDKQKFDSVALAEVFAKTGRQGLDMLQTDRAEFLFSDNIRGSLSFLIDKDAKHGASVDYIRVVTDKESPGCPGRLPISEDAQNILTSHDLFPHPEHPKDVSAISIIAKRVRMFIFSELSRLENELSDEEKASLTTFDRVVLERNLLHQ